MSIIDKLVYDRTAQDVAQLTEKGHYNTTDLNRVGDAMGYIAGRFQAAGYSVSVTSRTDWAVGETPRQADMDTYLGDLAALRAVLAVLAATPQAPESMAGLTWQEANDIEKILADVDRLLTSVAAVYLRAGMPWAQAGVTIYAKN